MAHVPSYSSATLVGEVLEGVVVRKKKRKEYLVLAIRESPSTRSRNVAIPIHVPTFTIFQMAVIKVSGCRYYSSHEIISTDPNDLSLFRGMLFGQTVEMVTCAPTSAAVRKLLEEFPLIDQRRKLLTPPNCYCSSYSPETLQELDRWLVSSKLNTGRAWSWFAKALAGRERAPPPLKPARVSPKDLSALVRTELVTPLIPIQRRDFPILEHDQILQVNAKFTIDQERRIDYIRTKKNPQISWFVQRIYELYGKRWDEPLQILDVGGGRGDLARVLVEHFPLAQITIVDCNESSLMAGRELCINYLDRMEFIRQDFAGFSRLLPQQFDLVVALHACGGLSDQALEYAVAHQAAFVVCPCCYTKRDPACVVHRLAELMDGPPEIPRRAQHIINSNRLRDINYCFTSLEEYDISFSRRNMVLVGKSSA